MKNRPLHILVACFVLVFFSSATARIGETESQHEKRYGGPAKMKDTGLLTGASDRTYMQNGWGITVAFVDDVAVRIRYTKSAVAPGGAKGIQDDEFEAILKAELGGGIWTNKITSVKLEIGLKAIETRTILRANSNGRTALFEKPSCVTINSPEAEDFSARKKAADEAQRKATIPNF